MQAIPSLRPEHRPAWASPRLDRIINDPLDALLQGIETPANFTTPPTHECGVDISPNARREIMRPTTARAFSFLLIARFVPQRGALTPEGASAAQGLCIGVRRIRADSGRFARPFVLFLQHAAKYGIAGPVCRALPPCLLRSLG
jgi:hypothetical protein